MKKGFALMETIIVITFISVSLLLLYSTFIGMINSSKQNRLFDNVSNIYKTYYLKEYLNLQGLTNYTTNSIKELTCNDFNFASCSTLTKKLNVSHMYLVKYGKFNYDEKLYSNNFNDYLHLLSTSDDYQYRLIIEFLEGEEYSYASLALGGSHE